MKSESGQWITTSTTDGSNGRRNSSHGPWLVDRADWSAASSRRLSFSSSDDMLSVHSALPSCLQLVTRQARPPRSHLVNPSSPGAARLPALHARCLAGGGRDPSIAMPRATKPGRPVPGGAGHWLGISQPRCPPAASAQRWFMHWIAGWAHGSKHLAGLLVYYIPWKSQSDGTFQIQQWSQFCCWSPPSYKHHWNTTVKE